jgi:hypothetical protein
MQKDNQKAMKVGFFMKFQRIMKERHWEIAGWHDAGFRADSHGALPHTPGFSEA